MDVKRAVPGTNKLFVGGAATQSSPFEASNELRRGLEELLRQHHQKPDAQEPQLEELALEGASWCTKVEA